MITPEQPAYIEPGYYRHHKGGLYKVHFAVHHSETLEPLVIYEALCECRTFGKGSIWARPYNMFTEVVEWEGAQVPRFYKIEESDIDPSELT